jgi:hypothetical protein
LKMENEGREVLGQHIGKLKVSAHR